MRPTIPALALTALLLSACNLVEVSQDAPAPDKPGQPPEAPKDVEPVRETRNVTYTGVVQPAGISIYQQGSHRLVLPGGKFILLESEDIDLNGYVEEEVQIFGALRPTVEAGGMIMRVERIELVLEEEDAEGTDVEEEEEAPIEDIPEAPKNEESEPTPKPEPAEEPEEEEAPVEEPVAEEVPEEPTEEPAEGESEATEEEGSTEGTEGTAVEEEPTEEESEEESEEEPETTEPDVAFEERLAVMAKQDYSGPNWTQKYCTSHIGFCVPVHRNWWFNSFGATNSTLWHVEFNSEPIESLGEGPIVVDLLAGEAAAASGTVDVSGGEAIGYTEWTFGRHFRISGDASLIDAVRYMTENITEYGE